MSRQRDVVGELLTAAEDDLLALVPRALEAGPEWALLVTVDCDCERIVRLWPLTRIFGMLRADKALTAKLHAAYSLPRGSRELLVVVCAPEEKPMVSRMCLEKK